MDRIRPPHRYLMGPGPSPVEPSVLAAMSTPVIGHLDPRFISIMDEVTVALRDVFQTTNRLTFPVSGTGSAGAEAAIVNMVEPGERVVVGVAGVFGARLAEMARRAGAVVSEVAAPWGSPVPTGQLADAVKKRGAKVVAIVHAETSTGMRQPVDELRTALGDDAILIVDAVTSLGGIEVDVDSWGIDVCFSGTQKCLSVPPGLAPITFSSRAEWKLETRSTPVQSWYLDARLLRTYWEDSEHRRAYHHTAPISMIYGLHEGLRLVLEEGLDARWARHHDAGRFLRNALVERGFELIAADGYRLPQLTAVRLPKGVDDSLRGELLTEFDIEVGGGLGEFAGTAWRIGLMGLGARRDHALRLIQALDSLM
jgi:alanine-glyoxylate transaminase/serine-glyoxylate transaminase/serine-pyruvate transaminase